MEFINNFLTHDTCINIIEKILKTNDFKLVKWKIKSLHDEYFNIKCLIQLSSKSDVNFVYFIIKNCVENESSSEIMNQKEVLLYKSINDEQKWIPQVYYFENHWLVMEDLMSTRYVTFKRYFNIHHLTRSE